MLLYKQCKILPVLRELEPEQAFHLMSHRGNFRAVERQSDYPAGSSSNFFFPFHAGESESEPVWPVSTAAEPLEPAMSAQRWAK